MATLIERAIGAAQLDVATYEEIEHDETALPQAMMVVAVAAIAGGIGSAAASGGHGIGGMVFGVLGALIAWFVWAFTIYLVGTRLLPMPETKADLGQLLRTTGFASAPGVIGILGVIPLVGGLVLLASSIWQLVAMVIAVRQALEYTSTGRAVAVCVIGFLAQMIVLFLFVGVIAGGVAALFGGGPSTITP